MVLFALLSFSVVAEEGRTEEHAEEAHGFEIRRAEFVMVGNDFFLNADIDFRFTEPVIEALENGVPLTLVLRVKIKRVRNWWYDETVFGEKRRLRIRYHPLARSYQLIYEGFGEPRNFASLNAMLDAMGEIRGWQLMPVTNIEDDESYRAELSVNLDIEALPLPLRPVAYVSPSWSLGSPKYEWTFKN